MLPFLPFLFDVASQEILCLKVSSTTEPHLEMAEAPPCPHAAPGSPGAASSATTSWAQPESTAAGSKFEAFVTKVDTKFIGRVKQHGGPIQFLKACMNDTKDKINFLRHLWDTYPECDDIAYHDEAKIPPVTEAEMGSTLPVPLHITKFGWDDDCSLKPPTGADTFERIIGEVLQDGVVTAGEPLLVVQTRAPASYEGLPSFGMKTSPLPTCSLAYVKGMARISSVISLLYWCWEQNINLREQHPKLYDSVRAVYVHHLIKQSKVEEALSTMKLSARGSIRRATNVIQIAVIVKNLGSHGFSDFAGFVRMHNQRNAKQFQIVGKKAVALKLLFEQAPEVHLEEIYFFKTLRVRVWHVMRVCHSVCVCSIVCVALCV